MAMENKLALDLTTKPRDVGIDSSVNPSDRDKQIPIKIQTSSDQISNLENDEMLPRRQRTAFSQAQVRALEKEFLRDNYLSRSRRIDLSSVLKLHESTIKVKLS